MSITRQPIALVTGANRGLGLEACRQLAQKGILTILTSRDEKKGLFAMERLKAHGLPIVYHQLDVANEESRARLFRFVAGEYGRLDILINNAGILLDPNESWGVPGASAFHAKLDSIRATLETNVYGPFALCQLFIPMMKEHDYGRVVNVSSGMGQLSEMNGYYPAYRISKTALNAVTRIFADESRGSNVLVNSASPGWVKTDMGGPGAESTVEEGVETILWLATLPNDGPTGGFFEDRKQIPW